MNPSEQKYAISIVSETWLPEINGVAMTLSNLANGLLLRGWQVNVIRPRQRIESQEHGLHSLTHMLVPGLPIPGYAGLRFGLPVIAKLKATWQASRPSLIHIATEGPLGWAAMHVAEALGIPVTTTFHTNFHRYCGHYRIGWLQGLVTRYLRVLHNRAKCTMVPSQTSKDLLEQEGYLNVEVLGRGVDTTLYHPSRRSEHLRAQWGASPTDIVMIYVGRLAAEKNLGMVAKSFQLFQQKVAGSKMVWVGSGPEYNKLRKRYPAHMFVGAKVGLELAEYYASADLFVFPSLTETYGNVVAEAMASGLAVVAYDYAAASIHIKHGQNGLLVDYGNEELFLKNIVNIANKPAWIKTLGIAAHPVMLNQSWHSVCETFEKHLCKAIQDNAHLNKSSKISKACSNHLLN